MYDVFTAPGIIPEISNHNVIDRHKRDQMNGNELLLQDTARARM